MDLSDLQILLSAARGRRVACVGDLMVDRFVHGRVSRLSAEAPVPILARTEESVMLGGAGNVGRYGAALRRVAVLVDVVGEDAVAGEARACIAEAEGLESLLAVEPGRPTSLKTRFVAAGQQLLRVDHEQVAPVAPETEAALAAAVRAAAKDAGAILLSD